MSSAGSPGPDGARHSSLGIASTALGAATWCAGGVLVVLSFLPDSGTYAAQNADKRALVFGFVAAPILHLIGLGLAIASSPRSTSRALPVIGIVLNGLPLLLAALGWILVLFLGLAVLTSGGGWH